MFLLLPFTVLLSIVLSHNVEPIQGQPLWKQVGDDIDGEASCDFFGQSVAMSDDGTRVVIGAPWNKGGDDNTYLAGHARIYEFQDSWKQVGDDIDGEAIYSASGGSVAMSGDGSRVAIGTWLPYYNNSELSSPVRVYEFKDSWTQVGADIDGTAVGDTSSGYHVAMSHDGVRIVIGAEINSSGGEWWDQYSHVRVYEFKDSWEQLGSDIDLTQRNAHDMWSLAMSGDGTHITIGFPFDTAAYLGERYSHVGRVRVYVFQDSWEQLGEDIYGEFQNADVGWSVAMSDDGARIAVGASNPRRVRVYEYQDSWKQVGNDVLGESEKRTFGTNVAISGNGSRVTIGDNGHVHVYEFQGSWKQLGQDIYDEGVGDYPFWSVAMSGDGAHIAIGALEGDCSGDDPGHVRIFQLPARCGSYSDLKTKFCKGRANKGNAFPIFWTVSSDKNKFKNKVCNTSVCKRSECCLTGPERTCANTGKKGLVCGGFTKQMCASGYKLKGKKDRAKTPCTGKNGAKCTVKDCCSTQNSI